MASPTRSATPSDTQKITAAHMTLRFGFMMGVSGWIQDDVARYTNPGEYINCSNPVCYSGGIKLGQPIRDMWYVPAKRKRKAANFARAAKGFRKGGESIENAPIFSSARSRSSTAHPKLKSAINWRLIDNRPWRRAVGRYRPRRRLLRLVPPRYPSRQEARKWEPHDR